MNFIWDKITEWLKGLLVSGIISNLSGLFDAINTRVGEAAAAAVVLMIPPIVIFVCSQSQILETMAHSGMKD